jgi:hypothetical protein
LLLSSRCLIVFGMCFRPFFSWESGYLCRLRMPLTLNCRMTVPRSAKLRFLCVFALRTRQNQTSRMQFWYWTTPDWF